MCFVVSATMPANARRLCEVFCILQNLQMYEVPERASDGKASGRCDGSPKGFRHIGLGLCEVAENRSGKFRFRRHVAKANFHLLNYEKKPIKLAFADYEARNFQLSLNPPFCKTLVELNLR